MLWASVSIGGRRGQVRSNSGEVVVRDGEAFAAWEDEAGVSPQELPLPEDLPPGDRG